MAPCKKGEMNDSEKKLTELINDGKVEEVKALITEKDVRNDCLDDSGMTPLQHAAYRGNTELCRLLLAHGADVNSNYHDSGYTALIFGALSGKVDTVRVLLQAGARTGHTNSVGRTAAQMAGFVGQHQVVSVINNFLPREDLEYYTIKQGLETAPKLPPHLVGILFSLLNQSNLHPVKISMRLQQNPEVIDYKYNVCKVLGLLLEKNMKAHDTNEVMAMKLHYLTTLIREAEKSRTTNNNKLDTWVKGLLRGREGDGFTEGQEKLIRATLKEFPYIESQLLQQMVRSLAKIPIGGNPTALCILKQGINGQRFSSEDDFVCATCDELEANKKCSACKMVNYCNQDCQKLHWFTHKKFCKALAEEFLAIEERKRQMAEITKKEEEEKAALKAQEEKAALKAQEEKAALEAQEDKAALEAQEERAALKAQDEKNAENEKGDAGENEKSRTVGESIMDAGGDVSDDTEKVQKISDDTEKLQKISDDTEKLQKISADTEKLKKMSTSNTEPVIVAAEDSKADTERSVSTSDINVDVISQ